MLLKFLLAFSLVIAGGSCAHAAPRGPAEQRFPRRPVSSRARHTHATPSEAHASAVFAAARVRGELPLHAFLEQMPKGADLHMHLSGAVYAETFLRDAAQDLLCIDPMELTLVKNLGTTRSIPPQAVCAEGMQAAASLFADQRLYDAAIDAFSMRSFMPSSGVSAHDQFFATFDRFRSLGKQHLGEWLDEVATRAAAQNEEYLEVMYTPSFAKAVEIASKIGWPEDLHPVTTSDSSTPADVQGTTPAELSALRDKLLASGLREEIAIDRAEFADGLAARSKLEHCDELVAAPGCSVEVRFLFQVLRGFPPQHVFAQTLIAFEIAAADPNVVGLNFVMPEDGYLAMSEYHRQMLMLAYLHSVYPAAHVSLHAGELAMSLVPPAGLRFHIREAVELGHAERIGHGVDIMHENDADSLLKEMASRHVMVEINLTSNDVILGVNAARHPLPQYRSAKVPLALATDDEGVSRIDLTHEYTRAALDFGLNYADLKQMARTSLEHTFLPGASLWKERDDFSNLVSACAGATTPGEKPSTQCEEYLKASPHAAQQWELEHRFHIFEASLP